MQINKNKNIPRGAGAVTRVISASGGYDCIFGLCFCLFYFNLQSADISEPACILDYFNPLTRSVTVDFARPAPSMSIAYE